MHFKKKHMEKDLKPKKDEPHVLCISCDTAYPLNAENITIHETIPLPTQKGKVIRFTCSKCKGETTSVVLSENDIRNSHSPILHQIKTEQQDRLSKEGTNRIMNENEVNKEKKNK